MKNVEIKRDPTDHVFEVLKEALNYIAVDVKQTEDGMIHLFFDGTLECDIEIKYYTDLRFYGEC